MLVEFRDKPRLAQVRTIKSSQDLDLSDRTLRIYCQPIHARALCLRKPNLIREGGIWMVGKYLVLVGTGFYYQIDRLAFWTARVF